MISDVHFILRAVGPRRKVIRKGGTWSDIHLKSSFWLLCAGYTSQEEKEGEESRHVAGVQGKRWQLVVGSEGGAGEKWTESGSTTWWKHLPVTWVGLGGIRERQKSGIF